MTKKSNTVELVPVFDKIRPCGNPHGFILPSAGNNSTVFGFWVRFRSFCIYILVPGGWHKVPCILRSFCMQSQSIYSIAQRKNHFANHPYRLHFYKKPNTYFHKFIDMQILMCCHYKNRISTKNN